MATQPLIWSLGVAGAVIAGALSSTLFLAPPAADKAPSAAMTEQKRPGPRTPSTLAVAADYRGHYIVHPTVENYRIKMMVDTGASIVALTAADARALGISKDASSRSIMLGTANGTVVGFRTTLREIRLGDIVVRNVEAVVLPAHALSMSLLGNSFLGKLQGYEVQTGRMVLRG
ncbi:TIGR02281 family clan AA aspartic protease [Bosea sp. (in: a-proteobacteria)]|uniref:retropepsin-like aspartic protease family protein n=1 Tax=Bosea sp. (in: a-proteobacteria) TaxID=1871050 RepID=UPI00260E5E4F|nr:TIGR02281 family clan AA aspartic protease [Bosea sp. (in: a-proteobacteria)]MCO5090259.1 TIGR02281 family clan AA aspartic protease [Bosea sp. (in: a-proteobacteria)]